MFLYYLAGAVYHKNVMWIFQWSLENLMTSHSALPIFDGVFGLLMNATSFSKILKAVVVMFVFTFSLWCLVVSIHQRNWVGLCLVVGAITMLAIINQYEIWAVVRYAKLLVFPFGTWLVEQKIETTHEKWVRLSLICIVCVSLLTNIGYGYYMAKIY